MYQYICCVVLWGGVVFMVVVCSTRWHWCMWFSKSFALLDFGSCKDLRTLSISLLFALLITGTGCVTLAGIIAAARAAKGTIKDMRFMCVGKYLCGGNNCTAFSLQSVRVRIDVCIPKMRHKSDSTCEQPSNLQYSHVCFSSLFYPAQALVLRAWVCALRSWMASSWKDLLGRRRCRGSRCSARRECSVRLSYVVILWCRMVVWCGKKSVQWYLRAHNNPSISCIAHAFIIYQF